MSPYEKDKRESALPESSDSTARQWICPVCGKTTGEHRDLDEALKNGK